MPGAPQPRYLHLKVRRPAGIWPIARVASVASVLGVVALLLLSPREGLLVFWGLVVPALPLLFVLAPGLWRNLCPMAAVNQLPRVLGLSRARRLPPWLERHGYGIGIVLFLGLAMSRPLLFEHSGAAVALLLGGLLVAPFAGGLLFRGKSGFCGSVCPLRAAQGLYGRAPAVVVPNAHCRPCVGCTTNCPDLKPKSALLDDLRGRDTLRSGYRRLFAAALPGFTYGFFTAPAGDAVHVAAAMLAGAGVFFGLEALTRLRAERLTAFAGAASLGLFYWFNVPATVAAVETLLGEQGPHPWAIWEGRGVVALLVAGWLVRGLGEERRRRQVPAAEPAPVALPMVEVQPDRRRPAPAPAAAPVLAGDPPVEIPDRRGPGRPMRSPTVTLWPQGRQVQVESGATLKQAADAAEIALPEGCGSGLCGCDPVYVLAGAEHVSAVGEDEQATLRRLALPDHARLACTSRVSGDVTMTLSAEERLPDPGVPAAAPPAAARASRPAVRRVAVIGNGIAGVTAASQVRRLDPDCAVDLVADSPHPFYNRISITKLINDPSGVGRLQLLPDGWYDTQRITQWLNTRVSRIDAGARSLVLGTGEALEYDRLILATGARSAIPPLEGVGLPGVFGVRHAEDAVRIRAYLQDRDCRRAVVVGGGLLGLEAADALTKLGLDVAIFERDRWLGHAELDERSGRLVQQHLEARGLEVGVDATIRAILGHERAEGIELVGGRRVDADLVLLCTGIVPNVELAREAGLLVSRGVVVDDAMRTTVDGILACGDVAEHAGRVWGRWPAAVAQGEVAAVSALGGERAFEPSPIPTRLKVSSFSLTAIGRSEAAAGEEEIVTDDGSGESYGKLVVAGGRLVGAIAFGDLPGLDEATAAVRDGRDVSAALEALRGGSWARLPDAPARDAA